MEIIVDYYQKNYIALYIDMIFHKPNYMIIILLNHNYGVHGGGRVLFATDPHEFCYPMVEIPI